MICAGLAAVWESIKSTPWTDCVFLRITSAKIVVVLKRASSVFLFNSWMFCKKARVFFFGFCEILLKKLKIMKIFAIFKRKGRNFFDESSCLDHEKVVFISILLKKRCVFQKYEARSGKNMYISILGWRLRRQNSKQILVFSIKNPLHFRILRWKWFSFGKGMEHRNPEKITGWFLCSLILSLERHFRLF